MASTTNITANSLLPWGARALALVLLALALPRLVAGFAVLPAGTVMGAGGTPASAEQMRIAADAIQIAERFADDGALSAQRSALLLAQAGDQADRQLRSRLMVESEEACIKALRLSPVQPAAWARLAWLREVRGDLPGAAEALRLSMLTGPFEPTLLRQRTRQGLRLLPILDGETTALLERQIRYSWILDADFVARLADRPEAGVLVLKAMAGLSDAEIQRFRRLHMGR